MADRYRLAPVRDARDREERVQKGNLAAAVEGARATEQQVTAAAAKVTAATAALEAARTSPLEAARRTTEHATATPSALEAPHRSATAIALARREQFVARRRRELDRVRDEHARAVASHQGQLASLDAARGRLTRARADREVIERHFARWRESRAKLAERRLD